MMVCIDGTYTEVSTAKPNEDLVKEKAVNFPSCSNLLLRGVASCFLVP
jgi:hypothetical protein